MGFYKTKLKLTEYPSPGEIVRHLLRSLGMTLFPMTVFFAFEGFSATIKKVNPDTKTIIVQLSKEELGCCKKGDKVTILDYERTEIAAGKVQQVADDLISIIVEVDIQNIDPNMVVSLKVIESVLTLKKSKPKLYTFALAAGAMANTIPGGGGELTITRRKLAAGISGYYGLKYLETDSDSLFTIDSKYAHGGLALVHFRYYPGKSSFNVRLGLGGRQIDTVFVIAPRSGSGQSDVTISIKSFVAQLAIGNHWKFSNDTFVGVDWIGYVYPLGSTIEVTTKTQGNINFENSQVYKNALADAEDEYSAGMYQALMLAFGYVF